MIHVRIAVIVAAANKQIPAPWVAGVAEVPDPDVHGVLHTCGEAAARWGGHVVIMEGMVPGPPDTLTIEATVLELCAERDRAIHERDMLQEALTESQRTFVQMLAREQNKRQNGE